MESMNSGPDDIIDDDVDDEDEWEDEVEVVDKNAPKLSLPADASPDEKIDFEMTGKLELYDLNKAAEAQRKESIRINAEIAKRREIEIQKAHARDQLLRDAATLSELKRTLATPEPRLVLEAPKEDEVDLSRFPQVAQKALRRLFACGIGWTNDNKIRLVEQCTKMPADILYQWASEFNDVMAADGYSAYELSPAGIMKGYSGLAKGGNLIGMDSGKSPLMLEDDTDKPKRRRRQS